MRTRRLIPWLLLASWACSAEGVRGPDAGREVDAGDVDAGEVEREELDGGPEVDEEVDPEDLDPTDEDAEEPPDDTVEPDDEPEPLPEDEADEEVPDPEGPTVTMVRATYRVLQWNIAGGKVHGCRTEGISAAVRRLVREHQLDFVGLNEVCPSQYEAIREALRAEWNKGAGATFSAYVGDEVPRVVGNAIFSRWNLSGITRQQVGRDRYGTRNLLCGRVAREPHLRFCSTHLTPAASAARTQLGRVHQRLETWWRENRDTVILTGDLNLRPDDAALDAVYAPGANHPRNNPANTGNYRELDDADGGHCPGYGERTTLSTTGGPCNQGGKIDFVFVRRNRIHEGTAYGADALRIPTTCGGSRCSDHRPVRGRVRALVRRD